MNLFVSERAGGKYIILSNIINEENNYIVVKRGKKIQLVEISIEMLSIKNGDTILEIKEGGDYRFPVSRPAANDQELEDIDRYVYAPESATRDSKPKNDDGDNSICGLEFLFPI